MVMALSTCFLPHFPRTLQGCAKGSASRRVLTELQSLRDLALPNFAALLGGLQPADLYARALDAKAKRERIYPPVKLFWAFLFQVPSPAMLCQEVVGKVRAYHHTPVKAEQARMGTAAFC
jgi:hypothetical protein